MESLCLYSFSSFISTRVINNFKRSSTKFINKIIEGAGTGWFIDRQKVHTRIPSIPRIHYPSISSWRLRFRDWTSLKLYINCIYENLWWRTFRNTRNACRFQVFFFFLLHHLFYINSEIKFIYAPLRNINNQSCASSRIYGKFTEYVKKDIKKTQRKILDSKGRGQIFVIRKQKYKLSRIFIGIKCFPRH